MKKNLTVIALICLLVISGVIIINNWPQNEIGQVRITITDDGIRQEGAVDIQVDNYYPGARVEVPYLFMNDSSNTIEPEIRPIFEVNTADYSKAKSYVAVPGYYSDWLSIPITGTIEPGDAKSYTLVLEIPKAASEDIPDKWAFKVETSGQNGGFFTVATASWWRIKMR